MYAIIMHFAYFWQADFIFADIIMNFCQNIKKNGFPFFRKSVLISN